MVARWWREGFWAVLEILLPLLFLPIEILLLAAITLCGQPAVENGDDDYCDYDTWNQQAWWQPDTSDI